MFLRTVLAGCCKNLGSALHGCPFAHGLLLASMFACSLQALVDSKSLAQEPSQLGPQSDGRKFFRDDFSRDTRHDYRIVGNVEWERASVTLHSGDSITHAAMDGAWTKIQIGLSSKGLNAGEPSELRIWFIPRDATPFYLRIAPAFGVAQHGALALVDTEENQGQITETLVKEIDAPQPITDIAIEYRHGLVQVKCDKGTPLLACLDNGSATIADCRIEPTVGTSILTSLSIEANYFPNQLSAIDELKLAFAQSGNDKLFKLYQQGKFKAAADIGRQVLEIRRRILGESSTDYSRSVFYLATLHQSMGELEKAERLYLEGKAIDEKLLGKLHPDYATTLSNLSDLYRLMGDFESALPLCLEAKSIREKVLAAEHPDYAAILGNCGALYFLKGDIARAETLLIEAKRIRYHALGDDHPHYANSLGNLAQLYTSIGDYARAESLYLEATSIRERSLGKEHPDYATSITNLAFLYAQMHDTQRAEELYREAMLVREKALGKEHPSYANSLNNLAGLYSMSGDLNNARLLFEQAKDIIERSLGEQHPDFAQSLINLASVYDFAVESAKAEPLLKQAIVIYEDTLPADHLVYALSLRKLAELYVRSNRIDSSITFFEKALSIARNHLDAVAVGLSERQQLGMAQMNRHYLDRYLSACLRARILPGDAVSNALMWKGKVQQRLRQIRNLANDPVIAEKFSALQLLTTKYSKLSQANSKPDHIVSVKGQLARLKLEKETLESELIRASSKFGDYVHPITFEQIQDAIPKGCVFVDYLEYTDDGERKLLAAIVRSEGAPKMLPLGPAAEVGSAIDRWRETFGGSVDGQAAGRVLRQRIWEPLLEHIGNAQTVLVSTDGSLGRLPLVALPGTRPNTYLIEDHRLALVPVPMLLPSIMNTGEQKMQPHKLLLMGDIDYDVALNELVPPGQEPIPASTEGQLAIANNADWLALDGAREELDQILLIYQSSAPSVPDSFITLRGNAASETAFRLNAGRCETLHLATHGFFAAADKRSALSANSELEESIRGPSTGCKLEVVSGYSPGQLSGIIFAGANRFRNTTIESVLNSDRSDDGIATADEIAFMNLENVNLVVLSACETGLGEVAGGEGLLGIQRAFQIAGARSTVASLWKVDDSATRALMVEFYKNMIEKKQSKLDALRNAQLEILNHYNPKTNSIDRAKPISLPGAKVADGKVAVDKENGPSRLSPRFWAAFSLSGDWR